MLSVLAEMESSAVYLALDTLVSCPLHPLAQALLKEPQQDLESWLLILHETHPGAPSEKKPKLNIVVNKIGVKLPLFLMIQKS